jgi:hypothetical protein
MGWLGIVWVGQQPSAVHTYVCRDQPVWQLAVNPLWHAVWWCYGCAMGRVSARMREVGWSAALCCHIKAVHCLLLPLAALCCCSSNV